MPNWELNKAENMLSECLDSMDETRRMLKDLAEHDTYDHVFRQASLALLDARDHVEDAIASVGDGFGIGDDDD